MSADDSKTKAAGTKAPPPFPPEDRAGRAKKAIVLFLIIAASMLAVDLGIKAWAFDTVAGTSVDVSLYDEVGRDVIPPHPAVGFIPKILSWKLVLNEGAVFGLGQGGRWFFILISAIATTVISIMFYRSHRKAWILHVGLALILAGALGNMYDRMLYGVVRDMCWLFPGVDLPFGWSWPGGSRELYPWIFNIADAALLLGVAAVMFEMFFGKWSQPQPPATDASSSEPVAD